MDIQLIDILRHFIQIALPISVPAIVLIGGSLCLGACALIAAISAR